MKKILIIAAVILVVGLLAFALMPREITEETSPTPAPTPPPQSQSNNDTQQAATTEVKMDIKDFAFTQKSITVKKGTKVTWTNQDTVRHDVASDSGAPAGGPAGPLLAKGESYSHTFDAVGTFPYHCTPHAAQMKATVTVTE